MVTAQDDDGVPVTRNSSFFKTVPAAAEENSTTEIRKDDVTGAPDTTDVPMQSEGAPSRGYPFVADSELHTNSFKRLCYSCVLEFRARDFEPS